MPPCSGEIGSFLLIKIGVGDSGGISRALVGRLWR
jgi:hypothetical protein